MPMMAYMGAQMQMQTPTLDASQGRGFRLGPNPMDMGISSDKALALKLKTVAPAMNDFTRQIVQGMQHRQALQQEEAMQRLAGVQGVQGTQGVQGVQEAQRSPFANLQEPGYFQLPPWVQGGQ